MVRPPEVRPVAENAAPEFVALLQAAFAEAANPEIAGPMARYMRGQFEFLGLKSPVRRATQRELFRRLRPAGSAELSDIARRLWVLPEREYQYAAVDLLATSVQRLDAGALDLCQDLITTKSWWDTVDGLAAQVAGMIVLRDRGETRQMDEWLASSNLWLRRAALIHQLKFKEQTDATWLFGACLALAGEREFFIRKAIGWALRQYSWTDPDAVRAFVAANEDALSPLSRREALLAIERRRTRARDATERIRHQAEPTP